MAPPQLVTKQAQPKILIGTFSQQAPVALQWIIKNTTLGTPQRRLSNPILNNNGIIQELTQELNFFFHINKTIDITWEMV